MRKILALLLVLSVLRVNAQTPVQVNAQLLPPYSLQVSDYYSPSASSGNKINLILLNRDFVRTTVKVRLRMTIESQGIRISTKENVTYPEITLTAGSPYYVAPSELSAYFNAANLDFSGITPEQYTVMGKLPENFYTFCFEAIETTTGLTVSNKGCAFAWMTLSDPPFLNIPAKAETITPNSPQNIVFQWTPRHTASPNAGYNTDYIFSITEVQAGDFNPEAAFTSHQPLYVDSVQATSFNYGPDKPQLITGKKYAWRVQAKAKQGLDNLAMFRNNGYSEVFWFDYKNNCVAPSGITATVQGTRVIIEWQPLPIYLYYKVDYREKNNPSAEWFSISNTNPRVVITDLNFSKEYEYRVGAACEEDSYNYSTIRSFTTGSEPVPPVANCGDSSNIPLSVQQNYLTTMVPGDSIIAGDFKVIATQVSGSISFTGEGYVKVPWLLGIKVGVKFNGIKVNTDRKLAYGKIETTYDPSENGITDIDEYIDVFTAGYGVGGVVTGQVTADTVFTFTIQWPGGITATLPPGYNPATGQGPVTISVIPAGGGSTVTYTVDHLPTTIQDAAGNVYQVNQDGSVTLVGHQGGATMLTKTNKKLIDADKALVKFVAYNNSKVQYAFDEWQPIYKKSLTFNKEYEKISCAGGVEGIDGGNYYVSAKAIAPGKTDYIKAVVTVSDNTISPDSIQFVNGKGTIYNRTRIDSAAGGYTYEIAVVGGPEKDAQEIYALYPKVNSKTYNFGKVLIASYPDKEYKVVLVPVNGSTVSVDSVRNGLKRIYSGINVSFNIRVDSNFSTPGWDLNNDGMLDVTGSSVFSKYSSEMHALKELYRISRNVDNSTSYLFIVPQSNEPNSSLAGEMVRGKQYGFLFANKITGSNAGTIVGHELGHGIFSLKHVFDGYGFQQNEFGSNLMNYKDSTKLSKLQWDYVHDPAFAIGVFGNNQDEQYVIATGTVESVFGQFTNTGNFANTYTFITPAGKPISLPGNAESVIFSTKDRIVDGNKIPTGDYCPIGALIGFNLAGKKYIAVFTGKNFNRYENEVLKTDYFSDNVTSNLKPAKAIVALPWYVEKLYFTAFQINIKPEATSAGYIKNSEQKYVGHGAALVNHFSIIDYLVKNIDPGEYSGFSDEFLSLMAQGWNINTPHKKLEAVKSNISFSRGALDYLTANKSFTGEGSLLAPLIISNAFYLGLLPNSDPVITCLATSRIKEFDEKIKELSFNTSISSFTAEKINFLNDYYKTLKSDLATYNLNSGTANTRDINELIEAAKNSQTILLNDLFPLLESECLYSNITNQNRIDLLKSLLKYANELFHESNPPFPFNYFTTSPEETCKKVMHYVSAIIDNSKFSNQQMAVINALFIEVPANNTQGDTNNHLETLYFLGSQPYPWLRNEVMNIFSLITKASLSNYSVSPNSFSLNNSGTVTFSSRVDYVQRKMYLKRNGIETAYNFTDLVSLIVPQSNSFILFDENQTGNDTIMLPAILVHHLIRIQNLDQGWQHELEQKAGALRILTDIIVMIEAIPTGGTSVAAGEMLWYWISGADILITLNKEQLAQSEFGRAVLEDWDKLIALVAVYQMGEYLVIENGNKLLFKADLLKTVIRQKFDKWLGIERSLRGLIQSTSRLNLSFYSSSLLTKTQLELEDLVLYANFTATNSSYKIGINVSNAAFLERNSIKYEFMTMEGTDMWYGTFPKSKTVLSSDEKLGTVTNGRFLKLNGEIENQTYDVYFRSTTNEVFIASNEVHVNATINPALIKANFQEFNAYSSSQWSKINPHTGKEMFNDLSGGYVILNKQHNTIIGNADSEGEFLIAEGNAAGGKKVQLLSESAGNNVPTPDAEIIGEGIFDFKNINSTSASSIKTNVRDYVMLPSKRSNADNLFFNGKTNPVATPQNINQGILDAISTAQANGTSASLAKKIGLLYSNGNTKLISINEFINGARF